MFDHADLTREMFRVSKTTLWERNGPTWRAVKRPGIFWQCFCTTPGCESQGQSVICAPPFTLATASLMYEWMVTEQHAHLICPLCTAAVQPYSLGFNNCWFRFSAVHFATGQCMVSKWTQVGDSYVTWSPSTREEFLQWCQVKITVMLTRPPVLFSSIGAMNIEFPTHPLRAQDICAICMENLGDGSGDDNAARRGFEILSCQHTFHRNCIDIWKALQLEKFRVPCCPSCRNSF